MFLALYVSVITAIIIITKAFFFPCSAQPTWKALFYACHFFLPFIVTGRHLAVLLQSLALTDASEALSYL